MNRQIASLFGLVALLATFLAINVLFSMGVRGARLDLTENRLFTLTAGSKSIASDIDEPIKLYFYYSDSLSVGIPQLRSYAQRVRELLDEFVRASGGKIDLTVIDPEPFSEAEDDAVGEGLVGTPIDNAGSNFYFGLVGSNSTDGRETIAFFDPTQEQFLEYEVSRLIYNLAHPQRSVVGVISTLQIDAMPAIPQTGAPAQQAWGILRELRTLFEVRIIATNSVRIPDDIAALMIVHPKSLSDELLYAIDQYVLSGGKVVVFVDPICDSDIPPGAQQNPMLMMQAERGSSMPRLFDAWGVGFDGSQFIGDMKHAQQVGIPVDGRYEAITYLGWLALGEDAMASEDAVTGRLSRVMTGTAGALTHDADASTSMEPLMESSSESMMISTEKVKLVPDPRALLNEFVSDGESRVIAARITGPASTAFPDGPPPDSLTETTLAESEGSITVVIVADVDVLSDQFWLREESLGPIRLGYRKLADNADFVVNVVDQLAGSTDLMGIRARGGYSRPFTLVDEIRKEAEQEFRAEEQRLQEKLRETEARITELQQQRPDAGTLILTHEQQAEMERFHEEKLETRRQLRAVRLDLRRDIEALGARLRLINIALVPAIVAVTAILLGVYRKSRRTADRRSLAAPAARTAT